jgi:release factor glutamine methyltransferase
VRYSDLFFASVKKFNKNQDNFALDIEILIQKAFNITKTSYWIHKNELITDKTALKRFYRYRGRALKNEPTAYILKNKEWYSRDFYVNKNVLIPRPETELLTEKAIDIIRSFPHHTKIPVTVLDIGAGSGIISIVIAKETNSLVTAVDISKRALYVLKKNIITHKVQDKVSPILADLFPVRGKKKESQSHYDLIVSNPPYIPLKEWKNLEPGVRDYEPSKALIAPEEGIGIIRKIAEKATEFLNPGGSLLIEFGYSQKKKVENILKDAGFSRISFIQDYNNIPRVAIAQL